MTLHWSAGHIPAWRRAFRGGRDRTFLWLGQARREALEALSDAVARGEPLLLLTGEAGAGKTMLADVLAARLAEDGVVVGRVAHPPRDGQDFWNAVAGAFGYATAGRLDAGAAGAARHVLILDEAQALACDVLAEVLHASELLAVLLVGADEIDVTLAAPEHAGLARRIAVRRRLPPLRTDEVTAYVRHRLACAGAPRDLFSLEALAVIATLSRGLPRLIDAVCERATAAGGPVNASIVERCGRELAWLRDDGSPAPGRGAALPGGGPR